MRTAILASCITALLTAATVRAAQSNPAPGPVKAFLLTGQSNMTGRGTLRNLNKPPADQKATLVQYIMQPQNKAKYKFLYSGPKKTRDGWTIRNNVFITVGDWPHLKPGQKGYSIYQKDGGLAPYYGGHRMKGFTSHTGILMSFQ